MIGNDIIDLLQAHKESNWKRKGFIDKIFDGQEQEFILSHKNPRLMVWILWSIKEAAYKIFNRENEIREFAPKKIICSNINSSEKKITTEVNYHLFTYYAQTIVFQNHIHSIALDQNSSFEKVIAKVITNYPPDYITYLEENNFLPKNEIILKNETGIPYLFNNKNHTNRPISISHHGNFLGIAYVNN